MATTSAERGADPAAPSNFAWVLGTGRCGSTLVHEILARHPDVGFVSNVQDAVGALRWTGRWNNALFRVLPHAATRKGRPRFAPSEAYRALGREVSPMLATPARDLLERDVSPWLDARLRRFFAGHAGRQGKDLFVHKFTGWPRAGALEAVFPGSRYVHVVRDGRAVASSWLQMDWWLGHRGPPGWHFGPLPEPYREEWERSGRSFVVLAGIAWKLLIDAFECARGQLPARRWLAVRYEDLLAAPSETLEAVLAFLGLPSDERVAVTVARHGLRPERAQAFRRDLGAAELAALDASLADHLRRFGYGV